MAAPPPKYATGSVFPPDRAYLRNYERLELLRGYSPPPFARKKFEKINEKGLKSGLKISKNLKFPIFGGFFAYNFKKCETISYFFQTIILKWPKFEEKLGGGVNCPPLSTGRFTPVGPKH